MWFEAFKDRKEIIIRRWLEKVEAFMPGQYNQEDLYRNGQVYVHLLLDQQVPLAEHLYFDIIPKLCKYHAERGTPVEHLLHSSHLWREAMLEEIQLFIRDNQIPGEEAWGILPSLHQRIDEVQRTISGMYWNYAQTIIMQKQKEIEELHHDRLNLLGKMAASMAHEIRNPLFAMQGFLGLIKNRLNQKQDAKILSYIDVVKREFDGLNRQITAFLSFSSNNGTEEPFSYVNAQDLIYPVLALLGSRLSSEEIQLTTELRDNPPLYVQRIAIQQVLFNVVNNSLDALSEVPEPARFLQIRSWIEDHHYWISVTDNGPGIPEELSTVIFEPFMTTKKNGTGLGLAICKQIMGKNKGVLSYGSHKGETVFRIGLSLMENNDVEHTTCQATSIGG